MWVNNGGYNNEMEGYRSIGMSLPLTQLASIYLCNIIPLIGIVGAPIPLYPSSYLKSFQQAFHIALKLESYDKDNSRIL